MQYQIIETKSQLINSQDELSSFSAVLSQSRGAIEQATRLLQGRGIIAVGLTLEEAQEIIEVDRQEKEQQSLIAARAEAALIEVEEALLSLEEVENLNQQIEQLQNSDETDSNCYIAAMIIGGVAIIILAAACFAFPFIGAFVLGFCSVELILVGTACIFSGVLFSMSAGGVAYEICGEFLEKQMQHARIVNLEQERDALAARCQDINLTGMITKLDESKKQAEEAGIAFKDIKPASCRYDGDDTLAALKERGPRIYSYAVQKAEYDYWEGLGT